jgi:hypothetical protein
MTNDFSRSARSARNGNGGTLSIFSFCDAKSLPVDCVMLELNFKLMSYSSYVHYSMYLFGEKKVRPRDIER